MQNLLNFVHESGAFPWLGGAKVVGDDWVSAAASIGAGTLGPVDGVPSNVTVNTPRHKPFVTKERVAKAHQLGMKVVPWTVDYEVTINKLIDDGADAIISDYPERGHVDCETKRTEHGESQKTEQATMPRESKWIDKKLSELETEAFARKTQRNAKTIKVP
jgi:Glycerophosphoryl diester phosphodiesterase family